MLFVFVIVLPKPVFVTVLTSAIHCVLEHSGTRGAPKQSCGWGEKKIIIIFFLYIFNLIKQYLINLN